MDVTIDQKNLRNDFGIAVVDHSGKFTINSRKGTTSFSFPDEHGEIPFVDSEDIRFEPNEIQLTCVLVAKSKDDFNKNYWNFKQLLEKSGLRQLKMSQVDGTIHEVYIKDGARINIRGKWKNGQIVSTEFNLPFVEPDPLAAAISFTTSETATFTATIGTIDKKTIVDWGDGVVETKDTTSQLTFSHDYAGVSGDKQLDLTFKQGLKDVTYLDVSGQALSGYLSEVENMKSLQTLHGYSTSIQGDLAAIKELTALSDCQLYSTNLGTYSASKLPGSDWDNINIDINSCVDIDNQEASQLLIDLDDSYQRTIPSGGTLDISGCNGGTLAYADLTADGQAAYDDLTNNYGWTITTD